MRQGWQTNKLSSKEKGRLTHLSLSSLFFSSSPKSTWSSPSSRQASSPPATGTPHPARAMASRPMSACQRLPRRRTACHHPCASLHPPPALRRPRPHTEPAWATFFQVNRILRQRVTVPALVKSFWTPSSPGERQSPTWDLLFWVLFFSWKWTC